MQRIASSCERLNVKPDVLPLPPGASRMVRLTLDPKGSSGEIGKLMLAAIEGPPASDRILEVAGEGRPTGTTGSPAVGCEWCWKLSAEARRWVLISDGLPRGVPFRYISGECATCAQLVVEVLPKLDSESGGTK